jgi:hypothetical protein
MAQIFKNMIFLNVANKKNEKMRNEQRNIKFSCKIAL